jgi:hypothetical protein
LSLSAFAICRALAQEFDFDMNFGAANGHIIPPNNVAFRAAAINIALQ